MDYVFSSACITGQLFRANGCSDDVMSKTVVQWALDNDVALIAIDCPETQYLGLKRKPMGKKLYLKTNIDKTCDSIVDGMLLRYAEISSCGHTLIGIIGVKFSPLCCTIENSKSVYLQTGILMEKLIKEFDVPFVSSTEKHKKKVLAELLLIKNIKTKVSVNTNVI